MSGEIVVIAVAPGDEHGMHCHLCDIAENLTVLRAGPNAVVMCVNHLADVTVALRRRVDVDHNHEVVFGRRKADCQRCRDLDAGSPKRTWGGRR